MTLCFSLTAFKILSLTFFILIVTYLCVDLFGPSCLRLCFLDLDICFLPQVREIFCHYFIKYILCSLLSLLLLGPLYCECYSICRGPRDLLICPHSLKILFFRLVYMISSALSSSSLIHFSISSNLLLIPSHILKKSLTAFFSSIWFFILSNS